MESKKQVNGEPKIKDNYSEEAASDSPNKFLSEYIGGEDKYIRRIEMIDSPKNEQR